MSDKVIDLEAARKRLRSPEPESLDYDEEIAWAEEEMDAVEEEIEGYGDHINDLTNYILELATYLGAITIARDSESVPKEWVEVWTKFKAERETPEEDEEETQYEIVFEPDMEFPTDDNNRFFGIPNNVSNKNIPLEIQQEKIQLVESDSSFRPNNNLQRAKEYVSQLAETSLNNRDGISTENIWQVHKKYIISEINSGLVIIDQHVAHERVLYEEALEAFESTSMASQTLLFPETLSFSPDDFDALLDVLPYLEKIGFKIKKQDQGTIRIDAIPSDMSIGNEKNVIREILDNFLKDQKKYSSFQEGLAAMFACKAAVKAGDVLVKEEMKELVNRLFSTKHPYYCPHGRPIIVQVSLNELDGRFERH